MGHNKDWSIGESLAQLEKYNGLGYARMGRPSPYVWSKTNQYVRGKYVADGVYSSTAVDTQEGCAALLARMMVLDPSINEQYKWSRTASTMPLGATEKPADEFISVPATPIALGTGAAVSTAWFHLNWWWVGASVLGVLVLYEVYKYWRNK